MQQQEQRQLNENDPKHRRNHDHGMRHPTKKKRNFRKVDWEEVKDTWDNESTSSWSNLTDAVGFSEENNHDIHESEEISLEEYDNENEDIMSGKENVRRDINYLLHWDDQPSKDDDGDDDELRLPSQIHIPRQLDLMSSFHSSQGDDDREQDDSDIDDNSESVGEDDDPVPSLDDPSPSSSSSLKHEPQDTSDTEKNESSPKHLLPSTSNIKRAVRRRYSIPSEMLRSYPTATTAVAKNHATSGIPKQLRRFYESLRAKLYYPQKHLSRIRSSIFKYDSDESRLNLNEKKTTQTRTSRTENNQDKNEHGSHVDGGDNGRHRRSSIFGMEPKPTKFVYIAVSLFILEFVLLIVLKRVGIIEPEFRFNDVTVAQRMLASVMNDTTRLVPFAASTVLSGFKIWGNESIITRSSYSYLTQETKRPGFQFAQRHKEELRQHRDQQERDQQQQEDRQRKQRRFKREKPPPPPNVPAKYPVVIIPGFVTSGLEVWAGKECARKYFRQRMWAAVVGARSFFSDRDCWRQHMMLDPFTGSDPEDVRLRASTGFEAVDYFLVNYWVFGKLIENLADVGYTPTEMTVETYDWRLAFPLLEERDGYFTRLKTKIESMYRTANKKNKNRGKNEASTKVVLTSHSMGVLVVQYFFAWVTAPESVGGGGGGPTWVEDHIHAFVNIAGTHLGVPKAITSLLSGEMSDTVLMNPMATAVEQFFGRKLRLELWNTWGSIWAMLPKGGNALWSTNSKDGADMVCPTTTNTTVETTVNAENESTVSNHEVQYQDPHCPRLPSSYSKSSELADPRSSTRAQFLAITDSQASIDEIAHMDHSTILSWRRNHLLFHHHHHHHLDIPNDTTVPLLGDDNVTGFSPVFRKFMAHSDFTVEAALDYVKANGGGYGSKLANAHKYSLYAGESSPSFQQRRTQTTNMKKNRLKEPKWHDPTQTPLPYAPSMKIYCLYGVGRPTERAYYYKLNRPEQSHPNVLPSDNHSHAHHPNQRGSNSTYHKKHYYHGYHGNSNTTPASLLLLQQPPLIMDTDVNLPEAKVSHGIKYSDGDGSVPLLSLGYLCADAYQRPSSGLNPSKIPVYTREYEHRPEFTVEDPMRGGPHSADHVDVLGNVDVTKDLLRILTDTELDQVNQDQILSEIREIAHEINTSPGGGIFQNEKQRKQYLKEHRRKEEKRNQV